MKKLLPFVFAFCAVYAYSQDSSDTQEWVTLMQQKANFYDIQKAFNKYWETHDKTQKGCGYKAFKRWEYFVEKRVYPTGDLSVMQQTVKNYMDFLNDYNLNTASGKAIGGNNTILSTTWTPMGPMGPMSGLANNGFPRKAGRDNFVTFHPTNSNIIYSGSPAGGLWVTTNGGTTWSTNTDNLPVTGCTDLAIDPTNPNIMYLATGDGEAQDTYAIGVLKSTDGGLTWNTTGLSFAVNLGRSIRRILVNPNNTQIIIAATSAGIYRSTDGGTSWSLALSANTYDLEFKPGNPNVVYAAGAVMYKSINGGTSFSLVNSGIPTSGSNRMAIAVTPADTNYVYVVSSSSSNSCVQGVYRSVNGASTFTVMSTTNILANACNATGTGCQGWYDLCIAASPANKDEVVVGGVNVWRSTNGGSTFSCIGCWIGTGSPPYVHADHHELEYNSGATLYSANDGGTFRYNGTSWADITGTRNIAQIYRIGLSKSSASLWITGHQDNGSNIYNGGTYSASLAGDGMDCFIDWNNNNNMFAAQPNGAYNKSTNGGSSWTSCVSGLSGTPAWVAPWKQDPSVATTLYAGYSQMFKSTNQGGTWTQLTATGGSGSIVEFAIAPSNNQVIYVIHNTSIFKTTNGGTSWTNVTGTIPVGSAAPTFITIDPLDPNTVFVTCSGYSGANKVFKTINGGTSWTNISYNLPNLPANCSVFEPGSKDRVYVGMDVGVYFIDSAATSWTLYNAGLPNVAVFDMEISPAAPGKIRAATYGRGVWEADVVPSIAPVSSFSYTAGNLCSGKPIQFTDQSSNVPTTWSWTVSPAAGVTIATASSKNPTISFPSAGTYTVSMTAGNSTGPGGVATQTVNIISSPAVVIANNTQTICAGGTVSYTASGAASYSWSAGGGSGSSATYTPAGSTNYIVTGTSGACSSTAAANVAVNPAPILSISGSSSVCIGSSLALTAGGAATYTWSTGATGPSVSVTPTVTTTYSVTGAASWGCTNSATKTITVNPTPMIVAGASNTNICTGSTASLSASGAVSYTWNPGGQTGNAITDTPSVTTTYTVTGTNSFGCSDMSMVTVSVSTCAGVMQMSSTTEIYSVFPNPTTGKLTIQSSYNKPTHVNVEVIDVTGKAVMKQSMNFTPSENNKQLDITSLPDGAYVIRMISAEGTQLVRIVKD